jgi:hypothetical protein
MAALPIMTKVAFVFCNELQVLGVITLEWLIIVLFNNTILTAEVMLR